MREEHPVTSTADLGCCYGLARDCLLNEDGVARCLLSQLSTAAAFDDDADKCDTRSQCEFRGSEDADCKFTPNMTEKAGCCNGHIPKVNGECGDEVDRERSAQTQTSVLLFGTRYLLQSVS